VKSSNEALERHAQFADKEKLANESLRAENDKLKMLVEKYEDERPELYLKVKSKVCSIM